MSERLMDWFLRRTLGKVPLGSRVAEGTQMLGEPKWRHDGSLHYDGIVVYVSGDGARVSGFSFYPQETKQSVTFDDADAWRSMSVEEAERIFGDEWTRPGWTREAQLYRRAQSEIGVVRQAIEFDKGLVQRVEVLAMDLVFAPPAGARPEDGPHRSHTAATTRRSSPSPGKPLWRLCRRVNDPPNDEPASPAGERLLDWLLEARLGPLLPGSPLEETITVLGEPWSYSSPGVEPPILKYPALEVFVSEDHERLAGFHIEPADVEEAVPYDDLELWQSASVEDIERRIGDGWERSVADRNGREIVQLTRRIPSAVGQIHQSISFRDNVVTAVGLYAHELLLPPSAGERPR